MKCICGKEISCVNKKHYVMCSSKTMSYDEYMIKFYLHNFPKLTYDTVYDLYVNKEYTLPMFLKEFGINYKAMLFIIKSYDIKTRSIKESNNLESVHDRFKKTCLERYGVDNPTRKGTPAYLKREQTILERYGSTNIFSSESFMEEMKKDDIWLERFGLTYHEFRSKRSSDVWKNKSAEGREDWLRKFALGRNNEETNIEKRFREMLEHYNLNYEPQYYVEGKFFDFYTEDVLVEVNGDYFHANKLYYSPDQILRFPNSLFPTTAKNVWQRDELKRMIANSNNYDVIYIWENEIVKCKTHEQLYDLFIERMNLRNVYEQPN